jgi:hypothetical protein
LSDNDTHWDDSGTTAKNLCVVAVRAGVQDPDLPRTLISLLQLALALPPIEHAEFLVVAMLSEQVQESRAAGVESGFPITRKIFLTEASASSPALVVLLLSVFLLLS